ncbi:ABC transporter permease [Murimonas intestini]|uniref:ABC-2 family transporter n=1 Tax=Murimonas intestini TaxID=1337051 RepID=A0AB73T1V7_9FIRM|nr:ABC transporter permease [Murimonas intestini]MCR1842498.1 ABC transporter permease [Murimonas intestini]MCR1867144.1 ABC transporter permease [Murimonas intestini]MCR1884330.1 ABC transporter permease [Murimonas intestini]
MFLSLFWKECRQLLRSITFYLYLVILVLFYFSQLSTFTPLVKPQPGMKSYGADYAVDKKDIMDGTLGKLAYCFYTNSYTAYPMGFYKSVKLDEDEAARVAEIIEKDTGMDKNEITQFMQKYFNAEADVNEGPEVFTENYGPDNYDMESYDPENFDDESYEAQPSDDFERRMQFWPDIPAVEGLTYDEFEKQMKEIDGLIGGGSDFAPSRLYMNAEKELTFEDLQKEYEDTLYKDKISNAYAREFCDYLGLMLAILPVFLSATRALRDRRAKAAEVIYARKVSSAAVILSRYLATLLFALLPVIVLGAMVTVQCIYYGRGLGVDVDAFAFLKHIFGWLMPTAMTALSVGFFFTELTDSPIAVLVQGIWWMASNFMAFGKGTLEGSFGLNLIPRWNTCGKYEKFTEQLPDLITNRIFYAAIALLLLAGTIIVYELKRKGKWEVPWKRASK